MLVDPDGNWPKWFESVVSNVGNAFSNSWSSMKKVFQKNTETFYSALEEITVIAYVKVDIGVQVGINSPYCSAKINASSIELFSGGVDLTSRESFIENTIADEGAIVRQENFWKFEVAKQTIWRSRTIHCRKNRPSSKSD